MPRHHVQHFEALRSKIERREGGPDRFASVVAEALASSSPPPLTDPLEVALADCVRALGPERVRDLLT